MSGADPHAGQPLLAAGRAPQDAAAAVVMLHGRGSSAEDILTLVPELARPDLAYLAPQAAGHSWYPFAFLAPLADNEPGLSSGLGVLASALARLDAAGIGPERTVLLGFSQGACLTLEFAARNPRRYGAVVGLSGGVIGPPGVARAALPPQATLAGTPVLLGCSDRDPHIPVARVHETARLLAGLFASVDEQIYPAMGHTVNADELARVRRLLDDLAPAAPAAPAARRKALL